ncbi:MAG: L-seryl-tRNA(Sec) selenium transferase [Oscillospiraceae bacterium]
MEKNKLAALPKMDLLLAQPAVRSAEQRLPYYALKESARTVVSALRAGLLAGTLAAVPPMEVLAQTLITGAENAMVPHLRPVINATGVVLHTNLGRAPLGEDAARAVYHAARGYSNLEYDLESGTRGSRVRHVEELLCKLTGAEGALVVNNNAAAVLLMLGALAYGKNVAISRGELVEIGGSFRVPDVMAQSGAQLVEVGSTNKTHLSDYRAAIETQNAQVLLKVHTSNFRVVGFTQEVPLAELVTLGKGYHLPVLYDLGSGALLSQSLLPALEGPTVAESLAAGADAVCFSGDKLLGGPQCGILLGKRDAIGRMKTHPLARALRVGKLTLAALEPILQAYQDPALALSSVPTLQMLAETPQALHATAEDFCRALQGTCGDACDLSVCPAEGQVGGGSLPGVTLPSFAVGLVPRRVSVDALEAALRGWSTPIVSRIHGGALLLDVRTLTAEDRAVIADALAVSLGGGA